MLWLLFLSCLSSARLGCSSRPFCPAPFLWNWHDHCPAYCGGCISECEIIDQHLLGFDRPDPATGLLILYSTSPSLIHVRQQAEDRPAVPILVFLATVIFFALTGAEFGFGGWIYTYTTSQVYANPTLAASINAAFWAAFTVGRLISIPLAVRLKPQIILGVDFCGVIASLLIIILFSSVKVLLCLGTIGTGLFMASIFHSLLNDAQSRMHMSGKITSWFFVGASLGSMVLPWIMGQLITPFGASATIIAVLVNILLATGVFYLLNMKQRTTLTKQPELLRSGRSKR